MPQPATPQTLANYLATGYWTDEGLGPHSFDTSGSITVNLSGLTASGKALARSALNAWEMVADVSFREVAGSADIAFDDAAQGASSSVRFMGGDTLSARINIGTSWLDKYGAGVGSYSFQTYVHEIGHALGLGHAGHYDGGADYAADAKFQNDSWQQTIMSYFNQDENTFSRASYALVVTPMMADVLAIQQLYGKPQGGATAGNTTYGAGADTGTYLDAVFGGSKGSLSRNALTIYDEGGTDMLDLSKDSKAQSIDLRAGAFSDVHGLKGNLAITPGTTIENVAAGSSHDKLTGNNAKNRMAGNGGNDVIGGRGGDDAIKGGGGRDSISGGSGNDRLGGSDDADVLSGGGGDDVLKGGSGADRLKGDTGNDTLVGSMGADEFRFTSGRDVVKDFRDGEDTLQLDNALWGNRSLSVDQVLDMARVSGGDTVFDFGNGHTLELSGFTQIEALWDDLQFV